MKNANLKKTSPASQQTLADEFNRRCPVGGHVNVLRDNGQTLTTRTRSEAQVLGGHTAVVFVEGIAGAYLLSRVLVLPPAGG